MYKIDYSKEGRLQINNWIARRELPEISRGLRAIGQVLLLAPKDSGLTTALVMAANQQQEEQHICYISGRDVVGKSEAEGFQALSSRLGEVLPDGLKPTMCRDALSFRRLLMHTLAVLPAPLTLIVDDLELFPAEWRLIWINMLRSIKHEQYFQPLWQNLRCLAGSHRADLLYQLDPASPLNFMETIDLGPVAWRDIHSWLAVQFPDSTIHPTAPLALLGWTQGNPVLCTEIASRLPKRGFIGKETIAATAKQYARCLRLPRLTDEERSLLSVVEENGTLFDSGSGLEDLLVCRGLLADTPKGRLHWSSPILALAWKSGQDASEHTEPGLVLNEGKMEARYQGKLLPLFPQELKILLYLARRPGNYLTAEAICRETSDDPMMAELGSTNVRVQIARLRRKLPDCNYVQTRRNIGYGFNPHLPYTLKS